MEIKAGHPWYEAMRNALLVERDYAFPNGSAYTRVVEAAAIGQPLELLGGALLVWDEIIPCYPSALRARRMEVEGQVWQVRYKEGEWGKGASFGAYYNSRSQAAGHFVLTPA